MASNIKLFGERGENHKKRKCFRWMRNYFKYALYMECQYIKTCLCALGIDLDKSFKDTFQ